MQTENQNTEDTASTLTDVDTNTTTEVNAETLVNEIASEAPTVDETASFFDIPERKSSSVDDTGASPAVSADESAETDAAGTVFNSQIHYRDNAGRPVLTPTGKFRKKRGASLDNTSEPVDLMSITARPGAVMLVDSIISTSDIYGSMVFGEYWKCNPTEKQALTEVWAKLVTYKNWDLGQGIWLPVIIVTLPFIGARVLNPEFSKRIKLILSRFKQQKVSTENTGENDNAPIDMRSDGERQDNTSENFSPDVVPGRKIRFDL